MASGIVTVHGLPSRWPGRARPKSFNMVGATSTMAGFSSAILRLQNSTPGTTDGNAVVLFRKSDVVSSGDLFDLTGYPMIDTKAGGSIGAEVDALNKLIEFAVPSNNAEGGTRVVPAHGRISDHADVTYYRDMITIVRDRIQDMIKSGMTLAQVKAARPTRDYDARYGKTSGPWTTDMFVEAAYNSLKK